MTWEGKKPARLVSACVSRSLPLQPIPEDQGYEYQDKRKPTLTTVKGVLGGI
jgi:hypothetical protein